MKVLSLFSGIGAFEKALDNMGVAYDLAGFSEIDKYATKSYCAIHGVDEEKNYGDITKIDETALPSNIDLITYGFPCQDISLAGNQKGLFNEDGAKTRSGLFFDALRVIESVKPKVAIAENVKNLTSKKFEEQFKIVLDSLEFVGYNNYWAVLNAKDYGIPQNRERVFIVSIRKDIDNGTFTFPEGFPLELRLKDMLEDMVDEKFYLSQKMIHYISQSGTAKFKNPDCKINLDIARPLTTALDKRAGTSNYIGDNLPSNYDLNEISGHGSTDRHSWDMVEHNLRIRKLTPKECWRLMGFDDSDFEKAEKVNSNTQLYKQAGNSIVVPVLEYILEAVFSCGALENILTGGRKI